MSSAGNKLAYDPAPPVLVIGNSQRAIARGAAAAAAAGYRMVGAVDLAEAAARLAQQAAPVTVFVELDAGHRSPPEAVLRRLDALITQGGSRGIVAAPVALTDAVAALGTGWCHLREPRPGEREAALRAALAPAPLRLHDIGAEARELRLRELSDEVGRIAQMLARLSASGAEAAPAAPQPEDPDAEVTSHEVRTLIRARRLRDQFFETALFADPAWDMLLDLFAARLEYKLVAVSSLCIAAAVPPTTALRWIKTMTDAGLVIRRADPQDGRRVFIELSDGAAAAMTAYIVQLRRLGVATV